MSRHGFTVDWQLASWGFASKRWPTAQLLQFLKDPSNQGRVLQEGLWRTASPKLLGDSLVWWGFWNERRSRCSHLDRYRPIPHDDLYQVSYVALMERPSALVGRGTEYVRRTNAFIRVFPRRAPAPTKRAALSITGKKTVANA